MHTAVVICDNIIHLIHVAAVGALGCVVLMFFIDPLYAAIAIGELQYAIIYDSSFGVLEVVDFFFCEQCNIVACLCMSG